MCKISNPACFRGVASKPRFSSGIKRFSGLLLVALIMSLCPAQAEPDDEYLQIYALIQEADSLDASGRAVPALAKYREVQAALHTFQRSHPNWNAKIISSRSKIIAQKVATLTENVAASSGSTAAGARDKQPETKAASASSAQGVKLLEAGAEPRKVLRLHPKPGDKQSLGLTLKMAVNTKMGEMDAMAMKFPAMKMPMDVTVKSVSPDGDITYEVVMGEATVTEEPGVMPQVAEAMKATFASANGLSGTGTFSNRGLSKGTDFKVPAGVAPQSKEAIEQMTEMFSKGAVPLPEEAVGSGARWEVKMPVKSQGMTIEQTTSYQLVSIEGERLTAKSTIDQHAANQKIQSPAMPGMKLDLTKMVGKGTADITVDLAQLLPSEVALDSHSELFMGMNMGGQKQAMTTKSDLKVLLQAK